MSMVPNWAGKIQSTSPFFIFKNHFITVLPFTATYVKRSSPFKFLDQTLAGPMRLSPACYMRTRRILLWYIHYNHVRIQTQPFNFLGWGKTESTWYVANSPAWCFSSRLHVMNVGLTVERKLAGETEIKGKPAPVQLCSPQIPHDMTWDRHLAVEA
jgi:hypothetical protein